MRQNEKEIMALEKKCVEYWGVCMKQAEEQTDQIKKAENLARAKNFKITTLVLRWVQSRINKEELLDAMNQTTIHKVNE